MKKNRPAKTCFFCLALIMMAYSSFAGDADAYLPVNFLNANSEEFGRTRSLYTGTSNNTLGCGNGMKLYIEHTNDINYTDLHNACPWEDIPLFGAWTKKTAYAIIRDSLGNWIRPAHEATWSSAFPSAVSVSPGPSDSGVVEGLLPARVVIITAKVDQFSLACSTTAHTWLGIFIVRIHGNDTAEVDSLRLSTDKDTTLYAMLRDADGPRERWLPASANWCIDTPATSVAPPLGASQWYFSPLFSTNGEIRASVKFAPDDSITKTIPFSFQSIGTTHKHYLKKRSLHILKTTTANGTSLSVFFPHTMAYIEAKVISCNGRVLTMTSEQNGQHITLSPKRYSRGVYFISLFYDNITEVYKFIIDR